MLEGGEGFRGELGTLPQAFAGGVSFFEIGAVQILDEGFEFGHFSLLVRR